MNTKNILSHCLVVAFALGFLSNSLLHGQVRLNEIDSNTPGVDTAEFIELYDGGVGNTDLTGMVVVLFNGNGDSSYEAIDLDGFSTDMDGFFVIGSTGMGTDIEIDPGTFGWIQNGADAVALYFDDTTTFPNGTAATTTNLVDALVYGTDDPDDADLLSLFMVDASPSQLDEDVNDDADNQSIQRFATASGLRDSTAWSVGSPTLDAANPSSGTLTLTITGSSPIAEDAGFTAGYASVTTSVTTGTVEVNVTTDDASEALSFPVIIDTSSSQTALVDIQTINDTFPDGTQDVTLIASAPFHDTTTADFQVSDQVGDAYTLVVNEVYYNIDTTTGDANMDSVVDTSIAGDDLFIELVNVSASPIDLSDYIVVDNFGTGNIHDFRLGTVIDPGCAIVIFGGGVTEGTISTTLGFGSAELQNSTNGGLFLSNDGEDFVSILDEFSREAYRVDLPVIADSSTGSYNLATDADPVSGYVAHTTAAGSTGEYSPGTMVDGTDFCTVTDALAITSVSPSSIVEEAGFNAATVTVTLPSPAPANGVSVTLVSEDPGKIDVFVGEVTISSGDTMAVFDLDAVDNQTADGTVDVGLTAIASNYLNASGSIEVTDPVDSGSASDILFTQYYEGTGVNKYVEITNIGATDITLDGWSLTLWSNSNSEGWKSGSTATASSDLTGETVLAGQTIVIANPGAGVSGVTPTFSDGVINFNGNDSMVLFNGTTVVDALSFTSGNEGANTSFVRIATGTGFDTTLGTSIEDYPFVWEEVDTATVDAAGSGVNEFLGSYVPPAAPPVLTLAVSPDTISENGGTSTGTVTRVNSDNSSALTVSLTSDDLTEATVPASVMIPATVDSTTFTVTAVDDLDDDGTQVANLFATAPGFSNTATAVLNVTDDEVGTQVASLVINEVDADDDAGDDMEFVELFDTSGAGGSLDGFVLVFFNGFNEQVYEVVDLAGFNIPASGFFVVGDVDVTPAVDFVPSTFSTGSDIQNGADAVALYRGTAGDFTVNSTLVGDITNTLVDALVYDTGDADDAELLAALTPGQPQVDEDGNGNSSTESSSRVPDGGTPLNTSTYVAQTATPGATNGVASAMLTLSVSPESVSEGDGAAASTGTVTRVNADNSSALIVSLSSDDTTEATVPTSVTIPATIDSTTFPIMAEDDLDVDGTQIANILATAPGFADTATAALSVTDNEVLTAFTDLVINELDTDTTTEGMEFVELYNNTGNAESLENLVLVLINGNGDVVYDAIELSGTIPANGFFVIGDPDVSPLPDIVPAGFSASSSDIQNGADAVAIYVGTAADFPNGTAVGTISNSIVDAVVYDTSDGDDIDLINALTPGQAQVDEDGGIDKDIESNSRVPDGGTALDTATYVQQAPTPGATNVLGGGGNTFADWIAGFPGVGGENGFGDDPNNNGIPNGVENVLGQDPSADGGEVNALQMVSTGPNTLTFRHPLNVSVASDLDWEYEWSVDATNWNASGASSGGITVTFVDPPVIIAVTTGANIVETTATITGSTTAILQARIKVTQTP
ncbi:MAG: lamin tail domain-containing protein [Verrucomicrobiota bacterium]